MGTAATTETKSTDKPIGKKGIADAALVDEMKQLGWNAKQQSDGTGYSAFEKAGDLRSIGPVKSLEALAEQVRIASGAPQPAGNGKSNVAPFEARTGEEQRLPTMEEPEIDELNRLGDDCIELKQKRDNAKSEFDDACDIMRQKMRDHGRKRYNRQGFSLVIEDTEKLVIKKAEKAPPKSPRQPKQNKTITI